MTDTSAPPDGWGASSSPWPAASSSFNDSESLLLFHEDICLALQSRRSEDYGGARKAVLGDPGTWAFLVIFSAASVVGVLGNGLSMFVYATKVKRTPTTAFLVALAAVDLLVCLLVVPLRFASLLIVEVGSDVVCKGGEFLFFLAIPMSCFILLAIAVERFVTICLSKASCLTPAVVRVVLAAIFCASAAIASPSLLMVSVHFRVAIDGRPPVVCNMGLCKPTHDYIGQAGGWAYWMFLAAIFIVMAIAILAIYATIFARVMSARSKLSRWKPSRGSGDLAASSIYAAAAAAAAAAGTATSTTATAAEQKVPVVDERAECSGDAQARTETVELSETVNGGGGGGGGSSRSASPTAALTAASAAEAYYAAADVSGGGAREGGALLRDDPDESSTAPLSRKRSRNSAGREPSGGGGGSVAVGSRCSGCGGGPGAARPKSKKRSAHLSTAVALCAVTGAFIIAYTPVMVMSLAGSVCELDPVALGKSTECDWLAWNVLWHFFLFNHAANPIIYAFMNPRFKQALRSMVCRGG